MKFLFLFACLVLFAVAEKARFDNYRAYSVLIENEGQLKAMLYLQEHSDSYDFWDDPKLGHLFEVLVPPHKFSNFGEITENFGLKTEMIIPNFQALVDEEERAYLRSPKNNINWTAYWPLADIYTWLDFMASTYSGASVRTIGTTHNNRDIKLFTISKKQGNRKIFIEANIHSREWISHATATWIINELLTSSDPEVVDYATNIDWHIIVVANPDGYEFSRTNNRNWRKTRFPVTSLCFGVDGNRNFPFNWLVPDETGNAGASTSPCSDTYAGSFPLSELETQAIESIFTQYAGQIDIFLSFHSYGHWLLHPWGHTRTHPPHRNLLQNVGNKFAAALLARDGINYRVGGSNELLYAATGTTPDQAYGAHNISISYTLEMRGNGVYGNHGFVLPPSHIIPNALEVFDGLKAMIKEARVQGYLN